MLRAIRSAALIAVLAAATPAWASPVTAIVAAYEPEWKAVSSRIADKREEDAGGIHFVSGRMAGLPVLLVESGIGPVNAAMATQIAIDRFRARRIVVVGIAGGIDPSLHIGDVTVPERWKSYLYSVFARSTEDGASLPAFAPNKHEHFGMIFPQPMEVGHAPRPTQEREWLDADAKLLAIARDAAADVKLARCAAGTVDCLSNDPRFVVGGAGVSGSAFLDNAEVRKFLEATYHARAVDMESAAVAQVASSNELPFIALRSLSDLAGGGPGANEMKAFEALASYNVTIVLEVFMKRLHAKDERGERGR